MDKDRILGILRQHEPELKAAGIAHLRLFGSVARGDAKVTSDIDLLVDLDEAKAVGLFTVVRLQNQLTDLVGAEVHLSLANSLRPLLLTEIARDAVPAF